MLFGRVMALGLWNLAKYLVVTTLFHYDLRYWLDFFVWECIIISYRSTLKFVCYSKPITEGIKKGETFASLLNIHGGDIRVVPTHLVRFFLLLCLIQFVLGFFIFIYLLFVHSLTRDFSLLQWCFNCGWLLWIIRTMFILNNNNNNNNNNKSAVSFVESDANKLTTSTEPVTSPQFCHFVSKLTLVQNVAVN